MELPPAGRRGSFLLVAPLLLISILLEQYWIVRLLPWLSDLGGVQPMIVFLDIPLRLPVIDWIPVGILFIFLYLVVISPELSRYRLSHQSASRQSASRQSASRQSALRWGTSRQGPSPAKLLWQKGWAVLTGWWLMLFCLAASGGLYYLIEDQLPKQVRNGIDSFGIRADISIPYPGEGIVHLHGGMIMLIALLIGGRFFLRRTQLPALAQSDVSPAAAATNTPTRDTIEKAAVIKARVPSPKYIPSPEPRVASGEPRLPSPEPRVSSPKPRVTSPMPPVTQLTPKPSPAIIRPCVVKGVLEPS